VDNPATVDDPATPQIENNELLDNVSPAICRQAGESIVSSVLYSLIYDSLDSRKNPREGIYAKFTQEFAGVGGDVSFLRTTGSATFYRELLADADVIGFVKVQGGHIVGIGEDVRLTDAFFKGGETVRGFESSGFGPRDLGTGDALGGNIFLAGTAEVQFPLPVLPREIGLKGAVFADAGTLFGYEGGTRFNLNGNRILDGDAPGAACVTNSTQPQTCIAVRDNKDIRSSVGASLLWSSPLGPIRFDYAFALTKDEGFIAANGQRVGGDRTQAFRFSGGTRF
jgi:outer membrane protein insertion porin family